MVRSLNRRDETQNIRAVSEMKMEGKRPRGRLKLRGKHTVRRDLKSSNIRKEWATDRERWQDTLQHREMAAKGRGRKRQPNSHDVFPGRPHEDEGEDL